jgi:hypothetical protein
MSKRAAPTTATTQPPPAKRPRPVATKWFPRQQLAIDAMGDGDILLKEGNFKFAPYNRAAFLDEWTHKAAAPFYEVIMPDLPARLYLDVEAVSPGPRPPPEETQAWLRGIIAVVTTALQASGVNKEDATCVLVTNDSRPSEYGWKRSFHLTWPNVVFEDNYSVMKAWIHENIMPVIRANPKYQWIAQYKAGPVTKIAVDAAVYSRYRAWRVSYASKKGKSALTPWDVEGWCALDLDEENERRAFIENTLCAQSDPSKRSYIKAPAAASVV